MRAGRCTPLTAEGLVGAAFWIVYARLLRKASAEPLAGLLGELMGMIVLPYLGPAAARREQARACAGRTPQSARARPVSARRVARPVGERADAPDVSHLAGVGRCRGACWAGHDPSNRQVGDFAGIQDAGQVSKLLRRLERLGLLANRGAGHAKGEPNAWRLTDRGEQVARSIRAHSRFESEAA